MKTYQSMQNEILKIYKKSNLLFIQLTKKYVYLCDGYQATRIEQELLSSELEKFIKSIILEPIKKQNVVYKYSNGDVVKVDSLNIEELYSGPGEDELIYTGLVRAFSGLKSKQGYILASKEYYVVVDTSKFVDLDLRHTKFYGRGEIEPIFFEKNGFRHLILPIRDEQSPYLKVLNG